MIETIISIIIKYWVEFLLGLVVAGGGFFLKRYFKLEKEERRREQEQYFNSLAKKIQEENMEIIKSLQKEHETMNHNSEERYDEITTNIQEVIDTNRDESNRNDEILEGEIQAIEKELNILSKGILSIQRKEFLAECRKLLAEDHIITLEEWEELDNDHDAYNGLGGNHKGDQMFNLVKKKFESGLIEDQLS